MIKLFDGFDSVTKDQWLKKASADLKGENPFEKFQKVLGSGIIQYPYYDSSDNVKGQSSSIANLMNDRPYDAWFNTERILVVNEKEANALALKALQAGANGIQFINKSEDTNIELLMKEIEPAYCYCSFKGFQKAHILQFFTDYNNQKPDSSVMVSIINDSPAHSKSDSDFHQLNPITPKDISISLTDTNLGSVTKSIARQMSFFVDIVCMSNVDNVQILFDRLIIENTCLDHYFFEIAKLRALRILFAEIGAYFDLESAKVFIQSETSGGDDKLENLLINTTQAMSAVAGGTDSIIVSPHINKAVNASEAGFASRIARNVSNLLNEESHFDKVKDPSAGSYYINKLTDEIVDESWQKFTEIEELGGFSKLNERIA